MKEKYQILAANTVYSGPVFSVVQEKVTLPNGNTVDRDTINHPGAAVFIPLLSPNSLLLVEQYRHSVRNTLLEFPAGTLANGESPLACAKREIVEEVGYAAAEWIDLGLLYPTPGFCNEIQHCFLAQNLRPEKAPLDEDEIITVVQLSTKNVEKAIRQGLMTDAKSIAIFTRARLRGLI